MDHQSPPDVQDSDLALLLDVGANQGFLNLDDLLHLVSALDHEPDRLDELVAALEEAGVPLLGSDDEESVEEIGKSLEPRPMAHTETFDTDDTIDTVSLYMHEVGRIALLTADEEIFLSRRTHQGKKAEARLLEQAAVLSSEEILECQRQAAEGKEAWEHLIRANFRLVVSIAKKHIGYAGHNLTLLDLVQEGNIGLIRAVDKFDYRRGYRFSTYATWWIRQAISRAISDQARTIRVPVHMNERLAQLARTSQHLVQTLGRQPTLDELAQALNTMPASVAHLRKIAERPLSLEAPLNEEDGSELGDFIEDDRSPTPVEVVDTRILHELMNHVLDELTPREALIIAMRYGLRGYQPHTLEELGHQLGVTRERVRQIETQALRRVRSLRWQGALRGYLEE